MSPLGARRLPIGTPPTTCHPALYDSNLPFPCPLPTACAAAPRAPAHLAEDARAVAGLEGQLLGQHLVQQHAQRPQVGGLCVAATRYDLRMGERGGRVKYSGGRAVRMQTTGPNRPNHPNHPTPSSRHGAHLPVLPTRHYRRLPRALTPPPTPRRARLADRTPIHLPTSGAMYSGVPPIE